MGWSVGEDIERRRHIGYGVPATCDQPRCGKNINRGLSYRCGDIFSDIGCGLYFCDEHLFGFIVEDNYQPVCDRCVNNKPAYEPTPDTSEWANHVLTDDSWSQWRDENPERVEIMREKVISTPYSCYNPE